MMMSEKDYSKEKKQIDEIVSRTFWNPNVLRESFNETDRGNQNVLSDYQQCHRAWKKANTERQYEDFFYLGMNAVVSISFCLLASRLDFFSSPFSLILPLLGVLSCTAWWLTLRRMKKKVHRLRDAIIALESKLPIKIHSTFQAVSKACSKDMFDAVYTSPWFIGFIGLINVGILIIRLCV